MHKGQTAMEYLLVVAFAFLLLIPIILITVTQSAKFSTDVTAAQMEKVGTELIDTINAVYYSGPPTKRTIKLYFPKGIQDINVSDNRIVFKITSTDAGPYEYALYADTNMTGNLSKFVGVHTITIVAGATDVNVTG